MSETNGTPLVATERDYFEQWHINCFRGLIDAIIDLGEELKHIHRDHNECPDGGGKVLKEAIYDLIGSEVSDLIEPHTVKRMIEDGKTDELLERVTYMADNPNIPSFYRRYREQEGSTFGYLYMLRIIRDIARMQGY